MSGFLDIISICIVALGIIYVFNCFKVLNNIRKKNCDKKELEKAYSYVIIVAILYFIFWLIKIKQ